MFPPLDEILNKPGLFTKIADAFLFFRKPKFSYVFIKCIGKFYPPGRPISPRRLRRHPFAVYKYGFMNHFLAVAAISTRE